MPNQFPVHVPAGGRAEAAQQRLQALKKYLLRLEEGELEKAAARQEGLPWATVLKERRNNPQFAEAEQIAKAIGNEQVEQVLRDKAVNGDYQSIKAFLEANDEKYAPKVAGQGHTVVVAVTAGNLDSRIDELRAELLKRKADTPEHLIDGNPFINRDRWEEAESAPTIVEDDITEAEIVE